MIDSAKLLKSAEVALARAIDEIHASWPDGDEAAALVAVASRIGLARGKRFTPPECFVCRTAVPEAAKANALAASIDDCGHEEILPTRCQVSGGQVHYTLQCRRCLAYTSTCKASDIKRAGGDPADVPERVDRDILQLAIYNLDQAIRDSQKLAITKEWWARYSAYLETPRWRKKSAAVMERDALCGACNKRPPTEAHHLTYRHLGNEPLFDLVGVCRPCHEKITAMDRRRRQWDHNRFWEDIGGDMHEARKIGPESSKGHQ